MKIQVTQEDIDTGVPFKACSCPLARAISRTLGQTVAIGMLDRRTKSGKWWVFTKDKRRSLPLDASRRALIYDADGTMEPFEFDLEIPA